MAPPDDERSPNAPAGWYADPSGSAKQRYWDGQRWTDRTKGDVLTTASVGKSAAAAIRRGWSGYRGLPNWAQWAIGIVTALVIVGAITGGEDKDTGGDPSPPTAEASAPRPVALTVDAPNTVRAPRVNVTGTVSPATAVVELNGGTAIEVSDNGAYRATVRLRKGVNTITVGATAKGWEHGEARTSVYRQLTRAELARQRERERQRQIRLEQQRERERQARILRQQQARDAFVGAAQTIDYNQLEKDADDELRGTKVKYTGQIFQIQEDYGSTVILLAVTDEGYGLWTDNVWVNYPGEISSAEEDIITVYGTVTGSQTYETQIGGETYVPRVRARYIDE